MAKIDFDRFEHGKPGKIGHNTRFDIDEHGVRTVYLHGHAIFKRDENGTCWYSLAGYPTVTTRDRVHQLLRRYGTKITGVCQRQGMQYATRDGKRVKIAPSEWYCAN